jgi:hypothetical protein
MVDAVQPPAAAQPPWTVTISEDEVLTVIGHLLSSAELCLYEPALYGSFRLLDATSRFLGTVLSKEPADHDAFLLRLKQEIDQKKVWMLYDHSGYRDFVQEVPALLAARLKERASSERGSDGDRDGGRGG